MRWGNLYHCDANEVCLKDAQRMDPHLSLHSGRTAEARDKFQYQGKIETQNPSRVQGAEYSEPESKAHSARRTQELSTSYEE